MRHNIKIESNQDLINNNIITKKALMKDVKFRTNAGGCHGVVYIIRHKQTGKVYVGATTETITDRILKAFKSRNNQNITRSIRSQSARNFVVDVIDFGFDKENLMEKERYWISKYAVKGSVYNSALGGGGIR
jgi:hypothetical protein